MRTTLIGMLAAVGLVATLGGGAVVAPAAAATDPCGPGSNPVVCENSKPGDPASEWDIAGAGDPDIQGFATDISVDAGSTVGFKIDTDARAYTIEIYRTGWYQGLGARRITAVTPSVPLPQVQPECESNLETGLYDCGSWRVSASWAVPANAVSGVYVALLTRTDTGGASHITFVVRDDDSHSDIIFQTSDTTWHAYNTYGGSSFYQGGAVGRAYELSYNRPFATRAHERGRDFYFSAEYAMVRFLEQNGYDVTYQAGVDTDRYGSLLLNHDVFLSVGHDEYWSGQQRANVEAARDAGVNLMFLSGNEVYWRTRWAPSTAGASTPYRTMVSYKETWSHKKLDTSSPEWTGTWRDPRYASPANGGGKPENALIGTLYMVNFSDLPVTVSAAEGRLRLWRNTSLASLPAGSSVQLAPHTVGYESNEDLDNGHRPAGLIRLSTTVGAVPEYLQDFGNVVLPGTTTHHVTQYRAASGALVFSAGSVQWTWGLDAEHDGLGAPADPRMRQATANVLADMDAQPATPAGIVATPKSSDTAGPTAQITSPAAGADLANGSLVTVSGTASDVGGRVAGVEVSLDAGSTWHPAQGRETWSYTARVSGSGSVELRARAVDDSANIGSAVSRAVDVACPCTVFGDEVPPVPAADDAAPVELGLRFTPMSTGFVAGVRFYKGPGNTGTHRGTLWDRSGQVLAQATFTAETTTGWQTVPFNQPVPVAAGEPYVVSYTAPVGRYAIDEGAFVARGRDAAPLLVDGGFGAQPAGLFGLPGTFPTGSFGNAAYYVDPLFTASDDSPLAAFAAEPLGGSVSVPLGSTVRVRLSKPVDPASVALALADEAGNAVAGSTAYDAVTRTVTFTPAGPLAGFAGHTATVTATSLDGLGVSSGGTWSFRTVRPASTACPCGLYDDGVVPALVDVPDPDAVTLGVRFTPAEAGTVTGAQLYKGPTGSGPYTAYLWGPDGQVLAQGQVTQTVTKGWQDVPFAVPAQVQAGVQYTVGYRAPAGRYSVTAGAFTSPLTVGSLSTPASAGVYTYGAGRPTAPTSTSYLVDVVYDPTPPGPAVTGRTPAAGAVEVAVGTPVSVTVSEPVAPGASLTLTDGAGVTVPGTVAVSADGTTVTLDPAADLPHGSALTVAFSAQTADDGTAVGPLSWAFTTQPAAGTCPCTIFGGAVPPITSSDDAAAIELGTRFTTDHSGVVSAVRFYRGAGNDGPHTVTLWSATGAVLATTTAPAATTEGWQTVPFPVPYPVVAGTTYTVSYRAPHGRYAAGAGHFAQPRTIGPLSTPRAAGVYTYGGGYPQYSWNDAGYWVDPVFTSGSLGLVTTTPAGGTTGVDPATTVSARLTYSPVGEEPVLRLSGPGGVIPGASSFDAATRTVTFTPAAGLPGGALIAARVDVAGASVGSWMFTSRVTFPAGTVTLWSDADAPAVASWSDPDPVQVGTRVHVSAAGTVHGIRFYKGAQNTGTHTGYLWSASGDLLASGTFADETATGWQTLFFDQPVTVTAGTDLVASYRAPAGHYAVTVDALAAPRVQGPLSTLVPGGAYVYGTGFPGSTVNHSYWVDVLFAPTAP
ncbi:DUF4082 domain-containing protein [Antribacter gilvus]|uniref:DUF4082 domain-containing protein n=1 Tax=Antribacter gilvus TaxID=2304675 RepID=UPI0013DE98C7|nr:DUF4082 domain-containing protein [Antribacter gilvus]